ncbi:anti-sigma factor family protein [Nocardia sp. NPDC052566]|uniref:anti-sigma factor family protein n=1 Tax=Nocardia sp. NPDC052566 TaxID=3364330 RepID=UPI0037C55E91
MTDLADDYTTWDAPYVLGSLTRSERREFEEHLAGCPTCRAGVAELAGLPGMLAMVDAETALAMIEAPEPPVAAEPPIPELLPRLAAATEQRRRRGRWIAIGSAVAAAAAAVAIAVPVVSSVTSSNGPGSGQVFAERTMQPLEPTPVSASVKLVASDGKTRVIMNCTYGPSDQKYNWKFSLFVTRTDGQQAELGSWPAGPGTELTIDRTIDGTPDQVRNIEIRSVSTGKVILTATV